MTEQTSIAKPSGQQPLIDETHGPAAGHQGMLYLELKDKGALFSSYMPFIRDGGLFIQTDKEYKLGEEIFILLKLMSHGDKMPLATKVVWITPMCAQAGRKPGIGVQFLHDEAKIVREKIESYLVGSIASDHKTDTM